MKTARTLTLIAFLLIFSTILFFTFRGSAKVGDLSWMPQRWGIWLDEHDEFRHFIGFTAFAAAALALNFDAAFNRAQSRFVRRLRSSRNHTGRLGALMVLVYLLELGQLALPNRDFDWLDVVNGWGGILAAWSVWFGYRAHQRRRRRLTHERRHAPINVSAVRFR